MKASPLALFIACPEPFFLLLSKQVLMCNPITACRKLPLSQCRELVVQLQLCYPHTVTAGVRAPRCCSARVCALELPEVFHCHCYTPYIRLHRTLPGCYTPRTLFSDLGKNKKKEKERKLKWLLLTNWFHNSFIKPYSKPFILAPFCSMKSCVLKGRGEFGEQCHCPEQRFAGRPSAGTQG